MTNKSTLGDIQHNLEKMEALRTDVEGLHEADRSYRDRADDPSVGSTAEGVYLQLLAIGEQTKGMIKNAGLLPHVATELGGRIAELTKPLE